MVRTTDSGQLVGFQTKLTGHLGAVSRRRSVVDSAGDLGDVGGYQKEFQSFIYTGFTKSIHLFFYYLKFDKNYFVFSKIKIIKNKWLYIL